MSLNSSSLPRTDFQNVTLFNQLFGNKTYTTPRTDIFESDQKTVTACLSLISEEYNELVEAIENKDLTETIDALADLIVVIGGMACRFGIDLDKASAIVHNSNMSKLCVTEEEAKATVDWYLKNETRYDSPYYELAFDQIHYVVRNRSTGKILKNINYTPANFQSMVPVTTGTTDEYRYKVSEDEERKTPQVQLLNGVINDEQVREERFQLYKKSHLEFIEKHDSNVVTAYNKIMFECRFSIANYDKSLKKFFVVAENLTESQIVSIFQVQEELCYLPEYYNMFDYTLSCNTDKAWILEFTVKIKF